MAKARISHLEEQQGASLRNLPASSAAGTKGGGQDATSASRGSARRHGHLQGIQQNPYHTFFPSRLNNLLQSAIKRCARGSCASHGHLESRSDFPNCSAFFWAVAVDYVGAFIYFVIRSTGNFEERTANCSAHHSNSSHGMILK